MIFQSYLCFLRLQKYKTSPKLFRKISHFQIFSSKRLTFFRKYQAFLMAGGRYSLIYSLIYSLTYSLIYFLSWTI